MSDARRHTGSSVTGQAGEGNNHPPSARSARLRGFDAVRYDITLKMYADCIIGTIDSAGRLGSYDE